MWILLTVLMLSQKLPTASVYGPYATKAECQADLGRLYQAVPNAFGKGSILICVQPVPSSGVKEIAGILEKRDTRPALIRPR